MELWDILDKDGNKIGKLHERGKPMADGEYHLIIDVWIKNSKNEFLISKRTTDKHPDPDKWAPTCGSAITGDDSMSAALRETKEELNITLNPENGKKIKRFIIGRENIIDVWLFEQEVDINDIIFQPGETDDAKWATADEIRRLISEDKFMRPKRVAYVEELFQICGV